MEAWELTKMARWGMLERGRLIGEGWAACASSRTRVC